MHELDISFASEATLFKKYYGSRAQGKMDNGSTALDIWHGK